MVHSDLKESTVVVNEKMDFVKKIGIDVVSAACSSLMVSPFITIVDRSIIENASGARPLATALKQLAHEFLTKPHHFMARKEFALIFGLYASTYTAANTIDTVCETTQQAPAWPKFIGTTLVNMPLCVAKDREFTRMFGVVAPMKVPLTTLALFATRDAMTVAASFSLPSKVSKQLQDQQGVKKSTADTTAQLLCPVAVQFLSTPLHLLGLDLYNNSNSSMAARASFVSREYLKSTLARCGRIGPAFGIGGVGNKYFRDNMRKTFL